MTHPARPDPATSEVPLVAGRVGQPTTPEPPGGLDGTRRGVLRGVVAALGGAGLVACSDSGGAAGTIPKAAVAVDQTPDEVYIGFCTDMSAHHAQALALCQRVLGADAGGPVEAAAAEMLQNQAYEVGLMHALLQNWGRSTAPPTEVMAWMGMAMPLDQMVGLASVEEMRELAERTGLAKGRMFLELMKTHHAGGVHMAEAVGPEQTKRVQRLATQMVATQSYEIGVFYHLLATTYS